MNGPYSNLALGHQATLPSILLVGSDFQRAFLLADDGETSIAIVVAHKSTKRILKDKR